MPSIPNVPPGGRAARRTSQITFGSALRGGAGAVLGVFETVPVVPDCAPE